MRFEVNNGVASEKLTPEGAKNSKESCTAPTTSENTSIAGDAVSPRKGEATPVATLITEGEHLFRSLKSFFFFVSLSLSLSLCALICFFLFFL